MGATGYFLFYFLFIYLFIYFYFFARNSTTYFILNFFRLGQIGPPHTNFIFYNRNPSFLLQIRILRTISWTLIWPLNRFFLSCATRSTSTLICETIGPFEIGPKIGWSWVPTVAHEFSMIFNADTRGAMRFLIWFGCIEIMAEIR